MLWQKAVYVYNLTLTRNNGISNLSGFIYFQLSQLIVNAGGVAAVIDCIGICRGNVRLPGIMMLGYVAAHSENLAMAVIISKVSADFPVPCYSHLKILKEWHTVKWLISRTKQKGTAMKKLHIKFQTCNEFFPPLWSLKTVPQIPVLSI